MTHNKKKSTSTTKSTSSGSKTYKGAFSITVKNGKVQPSTTKGTSDAVKKLADQFKKNSVSSSTKNDVKKQAEAINKAYENFKKSSSGGAKKQAQTVQQNNLGPNTELTQNPDGSFTQTFTTPPPTTPASEIKEAMKNQGFDVIEEANKIKFELQKQIEEQGKEQKGILEGAFDWLKQQVGALGDQVMQGSDGLLKFFTDINLLIVQALDSIFNPDLETLTAFAVNKARAEARATDIMRKELRP